MNVLLLCYQGDISGATYSIFLLADGLAKRGHTAVVGCRKESLLYKLLQDSPAIAYPMTFDSKTDRKNMRQIRDAVKQYDIQLINAQASRDRYTAIFANLYYGLKLPILHTRRQKPRSDGGFLQRWFYTTFTERIIAVSPQVKDQLKALGYEDKDLKVVNNGIPPSFFEAHKPEKTEELRKEHGIDGSFRLIGCVARHKNQPYLVRALALLPEDIKVMFVGIYPEELGVGELAEELGVRDRLIFVPRTVREEVVNYYPLFDAFCLPSHMEGLPGVLLEAMGMGIPCVGTRFGGIIEVMQNQENGLWYELGDHEELARQLLRVLEDQELRAKFIKNGKKAAFEDYSLAKTVDNYEAFFQEVIANNTKEVV